MTPQQMVALGIRLVALVLAFKAIGFLSYTASSVFPVDTNVQENTAHWIAGVYVVLAAFLWFGPMWLSHLFLPRTKFENRLDIHSLDAARVGCALIGLWIFASTLPHLTWFLFSAFMAIGPNSFFDTLSAGLKLDLAVSAFQLLFSVLLVTRSADFARLVIRERHSVRSSEFRNEDRNDRSTALHYPPTPD